MIIGKHTYNINNIKLCFSDSGSNLIIGNFCSIGYNCIIYLGGNHRTDWISTYPFGHVNQHIFNKFNGIGHPATKGNIVIENDVWIGSNVTIMSGVTIGDGAVIAEGSHVVKYIPPYTIWGGNPARLIKHRFDMEIICKLLQLKWWNMPDEKINELSPLLCSNNFNELFKKVGL